MVSYFENPLFRLKSKPPSFTISGAFSFYTFLFSPSELPKSLSLWEKMSAKLRATKCD